MDRYYLVALTAAESTDGTAATGWQQERPCKHPPVQRLHLQRVSLWVNNNNLITGAAFGTCFSRFSHHIYWWLGKTTTRAAGRFQCLRHLLPHDWLDSVWYWRAVVVVFFLRSDMSLLMRASSSFSCCQCKPIDACCFCDEGGVCFSPPAAMYMMIW